MGEPIGGREHAWRNADLYKLGLFTHYVAITLGWFILLSLPCVAIVTLDKLFKRQDIPWGQLSLTSLPSDDFWSSLLGHTFYWLLIVLCAVWFCLILWALVVLLVVRMKKNTEASAPQKSASGEESGKPPVKVADVSETPGASAGAPVSASPGQERKKAEAEKRKAEQERRRMEQEKREKIDKARKEFKAKAMALRDSIPGSCELSIAGGTFDFTDKLKSSSLKVTIKEGSLRPYLTWDAASLTIKVNDSYAFYKDGKARFVMEVSDPVYAEDADLKDEVKPETFEVVLRAQYPSAAQKFFDWKAKAQSVFRLENAKQGQPVDYDLKALLGTDPDWATWVSADGHGTLKPEFDAHRLKGEPSVGTDVRIRIVFACRGCSEIRHEMDLLLTCNMDAEQRWRQIENDDSDKEAVVSEDDRLKLAKMAEAVRSTANAYEVRKPDDLFAKPHRVSRRQRLGHFDLAYASIRGRSHVRSGSFREDDVEVRFFRDGKAVAIVVSDGAGSAPLSRRGSCIVTSVGIRSLVELGQKLLADPDTLKARSQAAVDGFAEAVRAIRSQIEFEADNIKEHRPDFQSKEMYATFLAALVLPTDAGHVLLSYSAGDGAIGLAFAGDATGIKCVPDHGQSAGQTLFVLNKGADDADKRLMHTVLPDAFALLLMSDGVSDPRIPHGEESKKEIWDGLAQELKPLVFAEPLNQDAERSETYAGRGALCGWLDSYEKGHHDDRTIAVLFHKLT
jgi:hypothetical protein